MAAKKRLLPLFAASLLAVSCSGGTGTTTSDPATVTSVADATSTTFGAIDDSGAWFAFQGLYSSGTDLGLMRSDGSDLHRIPGGPGNRWHPDWSPDGTTLAYDYTLPNNTGEIWMVRVDGTKERAVTNCLNPCLGHGSPAWSPDGRSIGFDAADDATDHFPQGLCYVGMVEVATGEIRRILEFPGCQSDDFEGLTETTFMRFSPDGSRIVLQGMGPDNQTAIFAATIEGRELRQLTEWGFGARPDWSPDGKWIVFQSVQPETHQDQAIAIHAMRPDGSGLRQLTFPTGTVKDLYPRYAPDGFAIFFSRCPAFEAPDCEARALTPDGAEDLLLTAIVGYHAVHVILRPHP